MYLQLLQVSLVLDPTTSSRIVGTGDKTLFEMMRQLKGLRGNLRKYVSQPRRNKQLNAPVVQGIAMYGIEL